jgi:cyanophycinase
MSRVYLLFLLFYTLITSLPAQEIGPARGSLVIVGGGRLESAVLQRFIELCGGPQAKIILIPTAGGDTTYDIDSQIKIFRPFQEKGAFNLQMLHTYDPRVADTPEFAHAIAEAQGVWFLGGRQWRLADAYLGTKVETALWDLLHRGGAIGGTSAGASIQASYLLRGDTKTNTILIGDHQQGFGFLKNVTIDQHLLVRNRQYDLLEVIKMKPELLGIGIDEGTAIVVQGDEFEVIGRSYVAIYDAKVLEKTGRFYFLQNGDRFHLAKRTALRPTTTMQPLELPAEFQIEKNK